VTRLNQDIDKKRPWETLRKGDAALLKSQLTEWFSELWRVVYWLAPFLPSTGEKVLDIISSGPITTHPPMFPRINSPPRVSS
jgi:methionyl-tRNA synthetase